MSFDKESSSLLFLHSLGMTRRRILEALKLFEGPFELTQRLKERENELTKLWGDKLFALVEAKNNHEYKNSLISELSAVGASYFTFLDPDYPESLKEIDDYPVVLYFKGDKSVLKGRMFSIVGTRFPSAYGRKVTREFADEISKAGYTIVSGMAKGVDTVAHRAALDNGMPTVAVCGAGIDVVYPVDNKGLAEEIAKKGLIITEYKPKTPPVNYNFPYRNRIISALSSSILVPEAGNNSGSLITVNYAVEQGKNVYIVPGSIYSPESKGANDYLKKLQGAMVTEINDILEDQGLNKRNKIDASIGLDFVESAIISELEKGERHFDELLSLTGLEIKKLNSVLMSLIMMSLIEETGNNYYALA